MKSLRRIGSSVAARASRRSSSEPPKWRLLGEDRQRRRAAALVGLHDLGAAERPSRISPAEGERRLCSAISEVPGRASASANGRSSSSLGRGSLELGERHLAPAPLERARAWPRPAPRAGRSRRQLLRARHEALQHLARRAGVDRLLGAPRARPRSCRRRRPRRSPRRRSARSGRARRPAAARRAPAARCRRSSPACPRPRASWGGGAPGRPTPGVTRAGLDRAVAQLDHVGRARDARARRGRRRWTPPARARSPARPARRP